VAVHLLSPTKGGAPQPVRLCRGKRRAASTFFPLPPAQVRQKSYKFNIAGYRLARLIGIENTPVYIERKVGGKTCSVSWWVDDVMMDEADRKKKKMDGGIQHTASICNTIESRSKCH
jgi:hypothetical protein